MSEDTVEKVARNPLFKHLMGDERCPIDYPWHRGGRCWPRHSYDTHPDSVDNVEPLEATEQSQ